MAYNFWEIGAAIRNELVTDLSGLVREVSVLSASPGIGPDADELPYVVIFPVSADMSPESFTRIASSVVWQIHIVDHKDNGPDQIAPVFDAIMGNAVPPGKATSGLHRRDLSITDDTLSTMELLPEDAWGTLTFGDDLDSVGMYMQFRAIYTKG